jgi:hypothetical protein
MFGKIVVPFSLTDIAFNGEVIVAESRTLRWKPGPRSTAKLTQGYGREFVESALNVALMYVKLLLFCVEIPLLFAFLV